MYVGKRPLLVEIYEFLGIWEESAHYKVITDHLIIRGLWNPLPKSPERTVATVLSQDIAKKGHQSYFRRVAPGEYDLNPDVQTAPEGFVPIELGTIEVNALKKDKFTAFFYAAFGIGVVAGLVASLAMVYRV